MISPLINDTLQGHIHNKGGTYVIGTGANTGNFIAIFAHTATVIGTLVCAGITGTLTSIDIPAGTLYQFPAGATSVTLGSGKATIYNA